ncbi:MAG: hypothetical protein IKM31_02330 [Oscillospiraceae bacterium]|nr:hypothetical protein [Oscillospiraceae bacterium]
MNQTYFFSDTGLRSLLMAEDIRRREPDADLCFYGVHPSVPDPAVLRRLSRLNAELTGDDAVDILARPCARKTFFLLSENDRANLREALSLLRSLDEDPCPDGQPPVLWVKANQREAELLLDSAPKETLCAGRRQAVMVHAFEECDRVIQQLFDYLPLYDSWQGGEKKISLLVLGSGAVAMQAVKTAAWMGQIKDFALHIQLMDRDAGRAEDILRLQCPELFESGEYDIRFISADTATCELQDALWEYCSDCNYIIAAAGADEDNILIGTELCSFYMARYSTLQNLPVLAVQVRDPEQSRLVPRLSSRDGSFNFNLVAFGGWSELYSEKGLTDWYIDRRMERIHMTFCDAETPEQRQAALEDLNLHCYNQATSRANALHFGTKLFQCGITGRDPEKQAADFEAFLADPANAEAVEDLARWEHSRWNAFMRSTGWRKASLHDMEEYIRDGCGRHQHHLARLHPCLVSYDELPEIDRAVQRLLGKKRDFQENDRAMIRSIGKILRDEKR